MEIEFNKVSVMIYKYNWKTALQIKIAINGAFPTGSSHHRC